ncbi:uncharacterized protein VTP21DRAFT_4814 [Calcarisporiella thermophila]|uniref:uncharacterized protein n=1 Tax=Calcarisporiella thermophila TaxID=911321 RepID=UPI0037436958
MSLIKGDLNKTGWEEAEFPILCETCLGDNPYVRMTKQNYGRECKICNRPFSVFRWLPGAGMRYKKTEICQTCAKLKNVCQTCLLDLQYGLPVQVRDTILGLENDAPQSDVNREYFIQNMESKLSTMTESYVDYSKGDATGHALLSKIARKQPYYKRNLPHLCSFYVKGECRRGNECPYRHTMPEDDDAGDLKKQNFKDRYYGNNDPVAKRMLNRTDDKKALEKPDDETVTSLFITGVDESVKDTDLKEHFSTFGDLKSVVVSHKSKCAFINFLTRAAAEKAAEKSFNNLEINGKVLRVTWARPRPQGPRSELKQAAAGQSTTSAAPMDYTTLQPPPPPGQDAGVKYASQDPTYQGSYATKH